MTAERKIAYVPLAGVKEAKKNAKAHDLGALLQSFERFGFGEPPLLDGRTGRLVAGHGRVEALRALKKEGKAPPSGVKGSKVDWLVPVVVGWSSKDDREADAYLLAANRLTELGGWDEAVLEGMLLDLAKADALAGSGWDADDVDAQVAKLARETADEEEDPGLTKFTTPWVKDGDFFALGDHRLLVGDSLVVENRAKLLGTSPVDLVLTDPPYAIYGSSSGIASSIADDKMVIPFFESFLRAAQDHLKEFGHLYAFTDWRSWNTLTTAMKRCPGLVLKNGITWDKGGSGLGTNYAMSSEWIAFAHRMEPLKAMAASKRTGTRMVMKPNVIRENRVTGAERLHNAAKPVAMLVQFIENSTDAGERIWEPFSGSGSTLIAAEKTGRVCFAGEMDPTNAQITVERWERFTGKKHERI